jgi:hypothetical protein
MPSVEYPATTLVYEEQTETVEHPETGEQVTVTTELDKRPFEVRINKWLEQDGIYHVYGYVEVTGFGQKLASQTEPYEWLTDMYQTSSGVTRSMISQWVGGVGAVENADLDGILAFGDVSPVKAKVIADRSMRVKFEIVLSAPTTFEIEWLRVDFDPARSGT